MQFWHLNGKFIFFEDLVESYHHPTPSYHHPTTKLPPNATLVAKKDLVLGSIVGMNW
jgi:hypothetical protein